MSQDQSGRERPLRRGDDSAVRSETRPNATPGVCQEFGVRFDCYFPRVYAYVSRRVSNKGTCERIVSEVLTANVDLFVEGTDERRKLRSLMAFSDRLIELGHEERLRQDAEESAIGQSERGEAPPAGGGLIGAASTVTPVRHHR